MRTSSRWMANPTAMISGTLVPGPARKSARVLFAAGGCRPTALATTAWKLTSPPTKMSTPIIRMTTPTIARTVPPTTVSSGLRWSRSPNSAISPIRIGTWLKMLLAMPIRMFCRTSTVSPAAQAHLVYANVGLAAHHVQRLLGLGHDQVHRRDLRPDHRDRGVQSTGRRSPLHRVHLEEEGRLVSRVVSLLRVG